MDSSTDEDEKSSSTQTSADSASPAQMPTQTSGKSRRVVGASVLPFAVDPQWGEVYFLLAKERRIANWNGSETWCDFGGSPKTRNGSEPAHLIAAREFQEESLAIVRLWDEETLPRRNWSVIADGLRDDLFMCRCCMYIDEDRCYMCYVKQIPWQPEAPTNFRKTHDRLHRIVHNRTDASWIEEMKQHPAVTVRADDTLHVSRDFMEKTQLRWYSIPQLTQAVSHSKHQISSRGGRVEFLRASFANRLHLILSEFPTRAYVPSMPGHRFQSSAYRQQLRSSSSSSVRLRMRPPPGFAGCVPSAKNATPSGGGRVDARSYKTAAHPKNNKEILESSISAKPTASEIQHGYSSRAGEADYGEEPGIGDGASGKDHGRHCRAGAEDRGSGAVPSGDPGTKTRRVECGALGPAHAVVTTGISSRCGDLESE